MVKAGDEVYSLILVEGDRPAAIIQKSTVTGLIPGYGVVRKIGDHVFTSRDADVFITRQEAADTAIERLRNSLQKITDEYERQIASLETPRA
jgi:hypothetical protein